MLQITKQDGTAQDYDRRKLLTSLIRAQATPEQALRIAQNIESWLISLGVNSVKSYEIKAKISEALKKINPDAAYAYEVYKKAEAEIQK